MQVNTGFVNGSVALITGAAGYIGSETCRGLAANNVRIVLVDKNTEQSDKLAAELSSTYNLTCEALDCDLMDESSFVMLAEQVKSRFGRLDYLVNNAAFYDDTPGWGVPFEEEGYEAWLKVMRVNTLAPFFLVQAMATMLKVSPVAAVVNVSSMYGVVAPNPDLYEGTSMTNPCAYGVSKAGLLQLTRWLSTVLAPAVRVNSVTPGGLERGQTEVFLDRYKARTPLGRLATENDVANAIVFLLSSQSSYITGQNVLVDGGWTVW